MARVLLIRPWSRSDENVREHDLSTQWRNGPYSLLLLAAILREGGHTVRVLDLHRDLVKARGDVNALLASLETRVATFRPDMVGVGFFSVHWFETAEIVRRVRCGAPGALLVAGGIHATVATESCLGQPPEGLGFDCACVGEGDVSLLQLADGIDPATVPGVAVVGRSTPEKAHTVGHLDDLPMADWSQCDHAFYSAPTTGRVKFRSTRSLDLIMGRGCGFRCGFCAYGALSKPRYHTADYVLDEVDALSGLTTGVYFLDSTIGTNRKLLETVCEGFLSRGLHRRVEWYANIRSDQVDQPLLELMWDAGCRYLFYGFESGSQRALDRMNKRNSVENNLMAAELHNRLQFPYNASVLVNYPGDTEEDLAATREFLLETRPPSIGVNWYVPLPGSRDFSLLVERGGIDPRDPAEWRRVGEVNGSTFYADAQEHSYREHVAGLEKLAYETIPAEINDAWRTAMAQ